METTPPPKAGTGHRIARVTRLSIGQSQEGAPGDAASAAASSEEQVIFHLFTLFLARFQIIYFKKREKFFFFFFYKENQLNYGTFTQPLKSHF